MAGFDFDFTHAPEWTPFIEACIRASKSRARRLRVSWRVEQLPDQVTRCIVNGQTRRLDLLGISLESDLPSVCEGVNLPGIAPTLARQFGTGFAELFLRGRDVNLGEDVQEYRPHKAATLYYGVYDLAWGGSNVSDLWARLRITESLLADYGLGRLPPVVLLEELHTACELTLKELIDGGEDRKNFWQLVAEADNRGYLPSSGQFPNMGLDSCDHSGREILIMLKDWRKDARHKNEGDFEAWLARHWECIALLVEQLARRLSRERARRIGSVGSPFV